MKSLSIIADFASSGGTRTYFIQLINYFSENYRTHNLEKIYVFLMQNQTDSEITELLADHTIFQPIILPRIFQFTVISKIFRKLKLLDWYEFIFEKLTVNKILKYKPDAMIFSIGNGTKYFYALTKKVPCLFISHTLMQTSPINEKYRKNIYDKIISNCNPDSRICAVSEKGKQLYTEYMPMPQNINLYSVLTNHSGYTTDTIIHSKHDKITILTLGLLASFKNPDLWLSVAKNITDKCQNENIPLPDFIWAGEGTYFDRLTLSAKDYPNIKFVGYKQNPAELYQNADIYVQPSTTENCCLSVIEAMKYSLPCVVSNVGGLPEQIENNVNGYLCQFDNTKDFEDCILELVKNPNKRTSFGKNSRKIFETKYSQSIWNSNFSKLINNVLK